MSDPIDTGAVLEQGHGYTSDKTAYLRRLKGVEVPSGEVPGWPTKTPIASTS